MAIQPIDLQTLFTQLDKVAKTQSAQHEGLALQQDKQGIQIQRRMEEQIQSVNNSQNTGDGAEKVKDQGRQQQDSDEGKKKGEQPHSPQQGEQTPFISDPSLGKNIDISL